jgi:hypothetical protein
VPKESLSWCKTLQAFGGSVYESVGGQGGVLQDNAARFCAWKSIQEPGDVRWGKFLLVLMMMMIMMMIDS